LSTAASSEAYLNNYTTTGGAKKRPPAIAGTGSRALPTARRTILRTSSRWSMSANSPTNTGFVAYGQNLDAVADVENWMRTFAFEHAVGNWDSFGYRNQQNMFAYKPERGPVVDAHLDINIVFGGGTRGTPVATNDTVLEIDTADVAMNAIYNTPACRRAYWAGVGGIANGVFINANADPVMDSRFEAFEASDVHVTRRT